MGSFSVFGQARKTEMIDFKTKDLKGDLFGGLTAGVVDLPLALAFGEASGAGPIAGLYGAIFVGFFASLFGGTASGPRPSTGAPVSVTEECVNEEADDDVRSSIAESRFTGEGVRCCGTLFSRDFFLSDLAFGPPNKLAHKPPSFLCLVDDVPMMHTDMFVYRHVSASDGGFWSNARHT